MVIRNAAQPRHFGLQAKTRDREQPRTEVGSQFVVIQTREGRNKAALRHFVDVYSRRGLHCQPRPKGPFEPADDNLKGLRIPIPDAVNRIVKRTFVGGNFPCHHTVMAANRARLPPPTVNSSKNNGMLKSRPHLIERDQAHHARLHTRPLHYMRQRRKGLGFLQTLRTTSKQAAHLPDPRRMRRVVSLPSTVHCPADIRLNLSELSEVQIANLVDTKKAC